MQNILDNETWGNGVGSSVVDPVLLYSEPGTREQDPHRDWPRKMCLEV